MKKIKYDLNHLPQHHRKSALYNYKTDIRLLIESEKNKLCFDCESCPQLNGEFHLKYGVRRKFTMQELRSGKLDKSVVLEELNKYYILCKNCREVRRRYALIAS